MSRPSVLSDLPSARDLLQYITHSRYQQAFETFSELLKGNTGIPPDVWSDCLQTLVSRNGNTADANLQGSDLLSGLFTYGKDETRFRLVDHIIRITAGSDNDSDRLRAYLATVERLLQLFPTLAAYVNKSKKNIFHVAAREEGGCRIIAIAKRSLLDRAVLGRALTQKDNNGDTPLAIAVREKDLDTVKELVDDDIPQMITQSVLIRTLTEGHYDIMAALVPQTTGPRSQLVTLGLLEKAIFTGNNKTWNYLMTMVSAEFIRGSDLLKYAVERRKFGIVESLLEKCPDLSLWSDENDGSVLSYNKATTNEPPELQQQIRDAIALKIIERLEPKQIRARLRDSSGYRREIGLDLSVLQHSPQELQRLLTLVKTEVESAKSTHVNGIGVEQAVSIQIQLHPILQYFFADLKKIGKPQKVESGALPISIEFEPYLRDVVIPLFGDHEPPCSRFQPMEPRCEVKEILAWLRIKRVQRILALHVVDSFHSPHTEETIESAVKPFDVDILDWRRMDLSIDCIVEAAANVTTLSLYSSGNWAVLSHWSGSDGVANLKQLKKVTINIAIDLIGQRCADAYKMKTETRLTTLKEGLEAQWHFEVHTWTWGTPPDQNNDAIKSNTTKMAPASVFRVQPFLESYQNFFRDSEPMLNTQQLQRCRTKIAIIDNGVQRADLTCRRVTGASFVYNSERESPWWLSQEPHGTQMANIIHELDSECELFIAKVGESKRDIRSDRVIEAIEWAVSKNVDVISMSLVLFNSNDRLTSAIESATGVNDIVMLCSTADDGNNYQSVWPANHPSVLAIAACNAFGKVTQWSTETDYNYVFQGEDILTTVHGEDRTAKGRVQASGSSVATAMAAGAVSLTIACHRVYEQAQKAKRSRRQNVVVRQILESKMVEKDSKYVQPKMFFDTPDGKPLGQPRTFVKWLNEAFDKGV